MKCVMCGGSMETRQVEHKEFGVLLGNYKAEVCTKCGETYYDSKTAAAIQEESKARGLFGLAKKAKIAEIGNIIENLNF